MHIWERGPHQFCVRVRRNGVSMSKTFETRAAADEWGRIMEGKVTGEEYVDRRVVRDTKLSQACTWYEGTLPNTADAKNKRSRLKYWKGTEFAEWSLASITPGDLLRWRRVVLDEDNADDGETVGPDAKVGPQTVVHRLNTLSQVYKTWALAHNQTVINPVIEGVRPGLPDGRNRRLHAGEEQLLLNACRKSSRVWLRPAVVIAIETCMRQGELASLAWERVNLEADNPFCDLPKTKNDRPRRVPLSRRAIAALRLLGPKKRGPVLPVETGRGIAHAFQDATPEETFPDLRWHDLRHEGISRLFEHTDLRDNEVMAISGHLRPEMLVRYTHLRADRLGARLRGGRLNRR